MASAPRAAKQSKLKKKSAVKPATKPAKARKPAKAAAKPTARAGKPSRVAAAEPTSARTVSQRKQTSQPSATKAAPPDLYSSLHALLHTMRLIERHDEPLCSMHDELKRTGRLSAAQRRRLQQLVDELPAEDYQADLETLRQAAAA